MGRACVPLFMLDRNEGFNLNCSWVQVPSRWGHPVRVECPYLCMYSIGTEVFTCFCLAMCSFTMGFPFYGRVAIPMYVLDRNEGFTWVSLALCSFAMESPFQGQGSIPVYVLDRIEGFHLNCSGFQVPSRWVHPVGSCIRFLYVHDRFVGTFCCWLLRPCLACHMALDSGLSSSGLICCYVFSSSFVGYSPLVVHP